MAIAIELLLLIVEDLLVVVVELVLVLVMGQWLLRTFCSVKLRLCCKPTFLRFTRCRRASSSSLAIFCSFAW
jgi:hypothetical protein